MRKDGKRTDAVSRKCFPREELFRLALTPDGLRLEGDGEKLPGRGIYLHQDKATLEQAKKKRILERFAKADCSPLYLAMEERL